MSELRKLNMAEWFALNTTRDEVSKAQAEGVDGKHNLLMAELQRLGFSVQSKQEIWELADALIDNGYEVEIIDTGSSQNHFHEYLSIIAGYEKESAK